MIEAPDFIWQRFPHAAGTATERFLRSLWGADTRYLFDTAATVGERRARDPGFRPAGRRIVCNIRRLPAWAVRRQQGGRTIAPGEGDDMLRSYSSACVHRWVRAEHLAHDLAHAFGFEEDPVQRSLAALALPAAVETSARIAPSHDEMDDLYRANPRWADLERRLYGALATELPVRKVA